MFFRKLNSNILTGCCQLLSRQEIKKIYAGTASRLNALQYNAKSKIIELFIKKNLPPNIGDNEALDQVHSAGICGTDVHIMNGIFPYKKDGPLVLRNEFSGIVAKIGKNIKDIVVSYLSTAPENKPNVNMDAIQFNAKTKRVELVKKEIPSNIADHEILVQVHYAGICGTDLHIIDGEFPCKQDGLVLGHEFAGVAAKVGKKVKHIKVGDKVVADPTIGCFVCQHCRTGNPHYCKDGGLNAYLGMFSDGGWEQYAVVLDAQIHKVPDSITLEQASLCEPISCISHSWDKISPIPVGSRILIVGSGIIGNLFISILHLQGHRKVTISEPQEARMKIIEKLDTGFAVITPDTLMQRQKKDPNYLFDLIIDCSGHAQAIEHAFTLMDFGGKMCIFGVANPTAKMSISPFDMFKKELTIYGVTINPFSFPKALSFLESMGSRYINFEKLGVRVFSLQQYQDAIQQLRKGAIAKATFKVHNN